MYRDNGFYLETGLVLPVCIQLPRAMGAVFSTDCENLLDSGTVPMPIGMQGGLRLTVGAHIVDVFPVDPNIGMIFPKTLKLSCNVSDWAPMRCPRWLKAVELTSSVMGGGFVALTAGAVCIHQRSVDISGCS